jgi:hypothetical protein
MQSYQEKMSIYRSIRGYGCRIDSIAFITYREAKMKELFKNRVLCTIAFLILCLIMVHSVTIAQESSDEELKKKYAPILGEYEFTTAGGTFTLKFYVEGGALWADSGDDRPATMEPVKDKVFDFTAEDPQAGIFEIKFLKDDQGKYNICHVVNSGMGLDVTGNKIIKK